MKREKVIVIVGPTSSGKTDTAVSLALVIGGEIISADSRQVYRGLDLGSGKVTKEEMQGISHHMIDVADPKETYTASDFVRDGSVLLQDILTRGAVPIIAGGTGFYIDALLGRVSLTEVPPNESLREELEGKAIEELQDILETEDPERYASVDTNNPRRLVRAIEIARALGKNPPGNESERYDTVWIGLQLSPEELKERIRRRIEKRLAQGMLDEARRLNDEGVSFERMEELGLEYRYMARHLSGKLSYEEMVEELFRESVKYAKRQMTWFKRNKAILWFSPNETEKITERAQAFIRK